MDGNLVANSIVAGASVLALVISVCSICQNMKQYKKSVDQFERSQRFERQRFLYDRRIHAYITIWHVLASVRSCRGLIKSVQNDLDKPIFDTKVLFVELCNNMYMESVQGAVHTDDNDAQKRYLLKSDELEILADSLHYLFPDCDEIKSSMDLLLSYWKVLSGLRRCFICVDACAESHVDVGNKLKAAVEKSNLEHELFMLLTMADVVNFETLVWIRDYTSAGLYDVT